MCLSLSDTGWQKSKSSTLAAANAHFNKKFFYVLFPMWNSRCSQFTVCLVSFLFKWTLLNKLNGNKICDKTKTSVSSNNLRKMERLYFILNLMCCITSELQSATVKSGHYVVCPVFSVGGCITMWYSNAETDKIVPDHTLATWLSWAVLDVVWHTLVTLWPCRPHSPLWHILFDSSRV